jgi:hypothetical protein
MADDGQPVIMCQNGKLTLRMYLDIRNNITYQPNTWLMCLSNTWKSSCGQRDKKNFKKERNLPYSMKLVRNDRSFEYICMLTQTYIRWVLNYSSDLRLSVFLTARTSFYFNCVCVCVCMCVCGPTFNFILIAFCVTRVIRYTILVVDIGKVIYRCSLILEQH